MKTTDPTTWFWRHALRFVVLLLITAGVASSAFGAIVFDSSNSGALTASGTSLSWSHTLGAGTNRLVVVGVAIEDTSSSDMVISSVTFDGVAMTAAANSLASSGTSTLNQSQLFYIREANLPAAGTYTVRVAFAGSVNGATAGSVSLTGVAQQSPEAVAINHVDSGSTISTNLTTLTTGAWVVDVVGSGASGVSFTASTSGMTERFDKVSNGCGGAGSSKAPSATGATTLSWTASSGSRLVHSLAAFAPDAGGGSGPFTLTSNVSGSGSVARNPNATTYASGTVVTLTATASSGYQFSGWSGDLSGSANPATITMNANKTVTATFTAVTSGPFTLTTNVSGSGSITRNPDATTYASGTVVSLTAAPSSGFQFSGWSGDLTGTTNPSSLTMNANKSVTATFTASSGGDLYVATDGTASNAGTISSPTTLESAITRIAAGSTIWVRGGTYNYSAGITIAIGNDGTSSANKNVFAYNGEVPVYNFSGQAVDSANRGITANGNFWHFKSIQVTHAGDNGLYIGGNNNTIELCVFAFNADSGLQLGRASTSYTSISQWPSNNLILNCESHDNKDPTNENADGFACKLTTGTGNVFRGCISHHNIDDGWDLYAKTETGPIGPVTIDHCISYSNGTLSDGSSSGSGDKNGFKLGGDGIAVQHTITRSIAFGNGHHGFTDNNNPGPITVTNNTSFNNASSNYNFRSGGHSVFTNNASLNAGSSDATFDTLTGTTNVFWKSGASDNNGGSIVISTADFQSLTPPSSFSRNSDGSINYGNFCHLASGSDLINAGSPSGTDIGAIESF